MLRRKKLKSILVNQSGVSLTFALMTLLVLSILGLAIATVTFANLQLTATDRDHQSAHYIAEAGVNQAFAEIKNIVLTTYENETNRAHFYSIIEADFLNELNGSVYTNFEPSFGEQPEARITIEPLNDNDHPRDYRIIAEGEIGKRHRIVTKDFTVAWQDKENSGHLPQIPDGAAAMVRSKLDFKTEIYGDVYLSSGSSGAVQMDWGASIIDGSLYLPDLHDDNLIRTPDNFNDLPNVKIFNEPINYQVFEDLVNRFPDHPTGLPQENNISLSGDVILTKDLTTDTYINEIKMNSDTTLNIDTKGKDIDLVVDHLLINQGHIELIGEGSLNIYVKESIVISGSSTINNDGETNKLNLFYQGSHPFTSGGNVQINGSFFNKNANLTFSGGQTFTGYVVSQSGDIKMSGGSKVIGFFVAPYSTLWLEGGPDLEGQMIVDQLVTSGGSKLKYKNLPMPEFPFASDDEVIHHSEDLIIPQPNTG